MSDAETRRRLLICFLAVFPSVCDSELATSSANTVTEWDSIAQVTLMSLVEEEFAISVPENQFGELTCFASLVAFLESVKT